jgi:Trypsin
MVGHRAVTLGATALVACGLAMGCSSSAPQQDKVGSSASAIQGGKDDPSHPFAVGVCVGGPGQCQLICSGALVAPNLVLTARHCVDQSPQAIDCNSSSTKFGAQHAATQFFYITTDPDMNQGTSGWHSAKKIYRTPGTAFCGNDMAMIELTDNVSLSEAGAFVTPVVQYSMTDHTRYSSTVTAIGYGINAPNAMNSSGTRRIRQNINIACIPGDAKLDCGPLSGAQLTANEFESGDGTCEGDSGSSAYEQKSFTAGNPVSFGVLSRGSSSSTACIGGTYTRTDAMKNFIVSTALTAAADGNYTPPSWTQAAPPPPTDGGTTTPPGQGQLGDACGDNTDCASADCSSQDNGTTYVCSQPCDNSNNTCPSGFSCVMAGASGECFPTPPANNGGGGTTTITKTSCSVVMGPDPTKPVPWGTVTLLGFAAFATVRRVRRNKPRA